MENKISCSTVFVIAILLFVLISFMRECNSKDELVAKLAKEDSTKKVRTELYKKKYNFNIDSIIPQIRQRRISLSSKLLKSPLIIFRQWKDEICFDDSLNKSIPPSLISYVKDSIKTIVLVERDANNIGHYSNNKTMAYQTNIIIHFIDIKTLKEIDNLTIHGELPAQTTSYRHAAPEAVFGSEPSFDEIKNSITSKFKK